ncbi:hypothetical protein So717_10070 [Roseobacter cerasinus]|uniref:Uncharacterized protein n=1 Tax=Roseobacter cerasinus TaxID=2602289 RepID=A0A640VNP3_9RHOB|nr:hypothetical protein So717_10070 [Roseobacter cerasinus]
MQGKAPTGLSHTKAATLPLSGPLFRPTGTAGQRPPLVTPLACYYRVAHLWYDGGKGASPA